MQKLITYLIAFIMAALLSMNASGSEINNAVICYHVSNPLSDSNNLDSALIGKITFESIPEYMQTTNVILEYYSQFETDKGIVLKFTGKMDDRLEISDPVSVIQGPIGNSDTLVVRLSFTPKRVGFIPFEFVIFENTPLKSPRDNKLGPKVAGTLKADILIGPDGKTTGIASNICNQDYATTLGPGAELLKQGINYTVDPKPTLGDFYPEQERFYQKNPSRYIFEIDANIDVSRQEKNTINISCDVKPYHDFKYGIIYEASVSDNISIVEMSPSINATVFTNQSYQFDMQALIEKPGLNIIRLNFLTPNPDYGTDGNLFSHRRTRMLSNGLSLFVGVDESGNIVFISDREPISKLDSMQKSGISTVQVDPRYNLIQGDKLPDAIHVHKGEGAREIINQSRN